MWGANKPLPVALAHALGRRLLSLCQQAPSLESHRRVGRHTKRRDSRATWRLPQTRGWVPSGQRQSCIWRFVWHRRAGPGLSRCPLRPRWQCRGCPQTQHIRFGGSWGALQPGWEEAQGGEHPARRCKRHMCTPYQQVLLVPATVKKLVGSRPVELQRLPLARAPQSLQGMAGAGGGWRWE